MPKLLMILAAPFVLIGCTHHYHPMEQSKKERLVTELIASGSECAAYKDRLASPLTDDDGVDRIFHEALKAHCVKKDV